MSAPYWIDIISEIVDNVRADSDLPALSTNAPYFMHGHPLEIISVLAEKDRHDTYKYQRYPIIALLQDFSEQMGESQRWRSRATMNIIIANSTSADYTSAERYTYNFRTVLYPIYDLLIKHIIRIKWFVNVAPGLVPHTKTDRLFWGRTGLYGNEANIFNDHIDAIEIDSLTLDLSLRKLCT